MSSLHCSSQDSNYRCGTRLRQRRPITRPALRRRPRCTSGRRSRDRRIFRKFPFTATKHDLRGITTRSGMSRRAARESFTRVHASSGTTGKPTVVGYTASVTSTPGLRSSPRSLRAAGGRRGMTSSTYRLRLRIVHRRPRSVHSGGCAARHARSCRCPAAMTERQVQLIR
jgi:hypothetical protein